MAHVSLEVIESITQHRELQPGTEAMYLLMPTSQNVDRIIRDFEGEQPQYGGAHLFFTEGERFPSCCPSQFVNRNDSSS